ncbi:hypothetical protein [Paenibacillus mucilaginosus]|uniref:Uncharacterized protein n=1 Tax=Paenibacillus mucilaginosus (strain KNP414) TaxID=1036673 RepID=F8FPQ7_PAEMK|nr:hypothetical protein [Paenibacillus mucilaginosus]AEI45874.1 hypothetical protein KNP414_07367 [Paenibacillus mucilaginosus KNP414]MCG7217788.1 hypothetical protein [Paenibacillus mucilaginosus]WDM27240.1 hypothetical protein KCX80_33420 [Paenibacillus mucilaginosus]
MRRDPKELLTAEEWKALLEQSEEWPEEWMDRGAEQELAALRREVDELRTAVLALNDRLYRLEGRKDGSPQEAPVTDPASVGGPKRTEPVGGGLANAGGEEEAPQAAVRQTQVKTGTAFPTASVRTGAPAEASDDGVRAAVEAFEEAEKAEHKAVEAAEEAAVKAVMKAGSEGESAISTLEASEAGSAEEQPLVPQPEAWPSQGQEALSAETAGRLESAASAEPGPPASEPKRTLSPDLGGEPVMLSRVQKYAKKKKRAAERSGRWFS